MQCGIVGCGSADQVLENKEDFWRDHHEHLIRELARYQTNHQQKWVIHVHFKGNDFGVYSDMETKVNFEDATRLEVLRASYDSEAPPSPIALTAEEAALEIENNFEDRNILASFVYRHTSQWRALNTFKQLFNCKSGKSPTIRQTLVVGSGGSHGAHELDIFGRQLQEACGKKLDIAILGDGILQPGPFPKTSFSGLAADGLCLHFYQRSSHQFLRGVPIEGCYNFKVKDAPHFGPEGLSRYPYKFVKGLLSGFHTEEPSLGFSGENIALKDISDEHLYSKTPEL